MFGRAGSHISYLQRLMLPQQSLDGVQVLVLLWIQYGLLLSYPALQLVHVVMKLMDLLGRLQTLWVNGKQTVSLTSLRVAYLPPCRTCSLLLMLLSSSSHSLLRRSSLLRACSSRCSPRPSCCTEVSRLRPRPDTSDTRTSSFFCRTCRWRTGL